MVIEDLSFPKRTHQADSLNQRASVQDRFLSFVFDFFILSPFIILINFPILKKIKLGLMLGEPDEVMKAYMILVAIVTIISVMVYQVANFYFYGASFGQRVFQVYLASADHSRNSKIQLSQAIQFSIGFILSFLLFGVPFLSVITHKNGLTFYQRLSEIRVLSLKINQANLISEFEIRFLKQWANMVVLFIFLIMTTFIVQKSFQEIHLSQNSKLNIHLVCENKLWNQLGHEQRLIKYFSFYLAEQKSNTNACLEHLIEEQAWSGVKTKDKSILYIIKFFTSNNIETQQLYMNELCNDKKSEACQLIRSYEKDQLQSKYSNTQLEWVKILLVDELLRKSKYDQAFELIKKDTEVIGFEKYYSQNLARIYYGFSQKRNTRSPASQNEHEIEKKFKEYFGVQ